MKKMMQTGLLTDFWS